MPGPHFCFEESRGREATRRAPCEIVLRDPHASALALLIPLLGCGEEAAALAFDGLAGRERDAAAAQALAVIGAEEREHDVLLKTLIVALPRVDEAVELQRAARRFHIRLAIGRPAAHLGRIAAIDAAVCTVLARLLRPGNPVTGDPVIAAILARIHRDEARHVRVSRRLAAARLGRTELNELAAGARAALADVLMLAGAAFETLGVGPDALSRDIVRVPDGLFAP